MKRKQKTLSTFEENLVWMSYRYCIGRKTAVAHSHAYDLMKYVYEKLEPVRKDFMCIDIYRSMSMCFYPYFVCQETSCSVYKPVNYIIDYIIENGIDTTKVVTITQHGNDKPSYSIQDKKPDVYGMESVTFIHDLCDIIPWQEFAEILGNNHKMVTTIYEGKKDVYECIETYKQYYSGGEPKFMKIYKEIVNGAVAENKYFAPEFIVKVEDKPTEE